MLSRQVRIPARRIAGAVECTLRSKYAPWIGTIALGRNIRAAPQILLPDINFRTYANGRPHPPGGTHRINLGGSEGEEKSALEQYGVDLTARAKDGKLDPVIGRDSEIHRTIQ